MNRREKALMIAMAIGDGHITNQPDLRTGKRYCSLTITHASKQKEYAVYKRDLVHSAIGGRMPNIRSINNNGYPGVNFSKGNSYFRILRKWLYPNGKKVISRFLLNKLTPEAIAIWYMDDGNLSAKKRNGKIHAYELFLNTHIIREENQVIIDYFKEVFDIQFHQVKNKGSYRLRMGTKEIVRFLPIITPYIVPSMLYKVTMQPSSRKNSVRTRAPSSQLS